MLPAGSLPPSGSVSPKQPMARPRPSSGSQRCFCSCEPKRAMGYITSADCTLAKLRSPESMRSSSYMIRP